MSLSFFAALDVIDAGFANGFEVLGLPIGEPGGNGEGEAGGVKTRDSLGAPIPGKPANLGLGSWVLVRWMFKDTESEHTALDSADGELVTEATFDLFGSGFNLYYN